MFFTHEHGLSTKIRSEATGGKNKIIMIEGKNQRIKQTNREKKNMCTKAPLT